jgi:hypothetical protein
MGTQSVRERTITQAADVHDGSTTWACAERRTIPVGPQRCAGHGLHTVCDPTPSNSDIQGGKRAWRPMLP